MNILNKARVAFEFFFMEMEGRIDQTDEWRPSAKEKEEHEFSMELVDLQVRMAAFRYRMLSPIRRYYIRAVLLHLIIMALPWVVFGGFYFGCGRTSTAIFETCGGGGQVCAGDQGCYKGQCLPATILSYLSPPPTDYRPTAADGPTDPDNCGAPGRICPEDSHCEGSLCKWDVHPEWCAVTTEICDGVDNDCNDWIDDGFDLRTDTRNCGVCGHSCSADQNCQNGLCATEIPLKPGCAPVPETCNHLDDDCDGTADNGFNLSNDPENCGACYHTCGSMQVCENGQCKVIPNSVEKCVVGIETCDGLDDDCNGTIDNGFNLSIDRDNCGECGNTCADGDDCENGMCVPASTP